MIKFPAMNHNSVFKSPADMKNVMFKFSALLKKQASSIKNPEVEMVDYVSSNELLESDIDL